MVGSGDPAGATVALGSDLGDGSGVDTSPADVVGSTTTPASSSPLHPAARITITMNTPTNLSTELTSRLGRHHVPTSR